MATPLLALTLAACSGGLSTLQAPPPDAPGSPGTAKLVERMVLVPAGEFRMGTDAAEKEPMSASFGFKVPPYENEEPARSVFVDAFYIDRFETTFAEYRHFIVVTGTPLPEDLQGVDLAAWPLHPVFQVSWHDADAYCKWRDARLPSEPEWEKAARGDDGRRFPWAGPFEQGRANGLNRGTARVGAFAGDRSPYAVQDMAGNVAEWVDDWYLPYPGNRAVDEDYGEKHRVVRGGSWGGVGHYNLDYNFRTAVRGHLDPMTRVTDVGFRCARSASSRPEDAADAARP